MSNNAPNTEEKWSVELWKTQLKDECVKKLREDYWMLPRNWLTNFVAIVGLIGSIAGVIALLMGIQFEAKKELVTRIVGLTAPGGACDKIEEVNRHLGERGPAEQLASARQGIAALEGDRPVLYRNIADSALRINQIVYHYVQKTSANQQEVDTKKWLSESTDPWMRELIDRANKASGSPLPK